MCAHNAAVQAAKEKSEGGKYVLIDVRPRARFEEGRIPKAVSVPLYQKVSRASKAVLFPKWRALNMCPCNILSYKI